MTPGRFPARVARSLPHLYKEAFRSRANVKRPHLPSGFLRLSLVALLLFWLLGKRRTRGVLYNFA
jgi:hypothetical protein